MAPKSLSKRAGIFMGAHFVATLIGTITAMVLARVFTKADMGNWRLVMRTYFFLSSFLILGLPSSLTYFFPTTDDKRRPMTVYVVVAGLFAMGLLLAGIAYFGAPHIAAAWDKERLVPLLERFCLFFTFSLSVAYLQRLLVSTNRYAILAIWLPADRLSNLLAFALPAYLGYSLEQVLTVGVIVSGIKFAIALAITINIVPLKGAVWDWGLVRRILLYSIPLGLSAASGKIAGFIDEFLIGRFETVQFYAVFSLGAMGVKYLPVIATSVMTVLLPELARLQKEGNYRQFLFIWHESIRKVAFIVLGVFAFVEVFAEPFVITMYSAKYAGSAPFFRLYQLRLVFRVTMFGYVMQSLNRTRIILYVTLVAIIARIPVALGLYLLAGPYALPLASLMAASGVAVFYILYMSKVTGTPVSRIWPWSYYFRILASAVIAAEVASVVLFIRLGWIESMLERLGEFFRGKTSLATFAQLVMGAAIFAPVYLLLLFAFKTIKKKDLMLLEDVTIGRLRKLWPKKESPGNDA